MKFFSAATALTMSLIGAASSVNGAVSRNANEAGAMMQSEERTMSAEMFRRILFQLQDIDTQEELMEVCDLTRERLRALQDLQKWLVHQEFDGEVETFKSFKEKAVAVIFFLVKKDPLVDELGFTDFLQIYSMSGISGLSFDELLECIGNGVSLSYDEILYVFCLGEPHFATWQGAHFDYHGACDLVLINNEAFGNGKGIDLHVRTEQLMPEGAYSFVSDAALRIGGDVLEIGKDGSHYFNGRRDAQFPMSVGGFPATRSVRENCIQNAENGEAAMGCSAMLTYDVAVGENEHIQMKVAKGMIHVEVKGRPSQFEGSVGIMGTYPHSGHGRVARDGTTVVQDVNEFGQEWQVRPSIDGKLFQNDRFPQFPQQCTPASEAHASNQRKLRAGTSEEQALSEAAHAVCDHISDSGMHKNCIFDVMTTGDATIAAVVYGAGF